MDIDVWYIIPATCLSLSIMISCCLFCSTSYGQNHKNYKNNNIYELPISINERSILLDDTSPPPYKERENTNIVLIL